MFNLLIYTFEVKENYWREYILNLNNISIMQQFDHFYYLRIQQNVCPFNVPYVLNRLVLRNLH